MTICQPAVWRGRQGGIRPCPLDPGPLVYADCREGPELRAALHRPGATRHPWRDAPSYGHPDRAPAPFNPPLGPADGADFGDRFIKQYLIGMALVGWLLSVSEAQRLPRKSV